jgi:hypothetical protein
MGFIDKTPESRYRANFPRSAGRARRSRRLPSRPPNSPRTHLLRRAAQVPGPARPAWPRDRRPNEIPPDPAAVTVINNWQLVGIGHGNHAERQLAMAIPERHRTHRTHRTTK